MVPPPPHTLFLARAYILSYKECARPCFSAGISPYVNYSCLSFWPPPPTPTRRRSLLILGRWSPSVSPTLSLGGHFKRHPHCLIRTTCVCVCMRPAASPQYPVESQERSKKKGGPFSVMYATLNLVVRSPHGQNKRRGGGEI